MIFAAGFDSSRNIFLGEKATKWENGENEVDGLTTNGVLIMHPKGEFCPPEDCPNPMPGIWREVSVSIWYNTSILLQSAIFAIFFGLQNISVFHFVQLPISIFFCPIIGFDHQKPNSDFYSKLGFFGPKSKIWLFKGFGLQELYFVIYKNFLQSLQYFLNFLQVGGNIFGLRESRSAAIQGPPVPSETNILVDGTLIDLCGATLLWRSVEGM